MKGCFSEVKLFQGKPDRMEECEALIPAVAQARRRQPGCMDVKDVKRFFTIGGVEAGQPPRGRAKIVKCVKCFSCWEFDNRGSYGKGSQWFSTSMERKSKGCCSCLLLFTVGTAFVEGMRESFSQPRITLSPKPPS